MIQRLLEQSQQLEKHIAELERLVKRHASELTRCGESSPTAEADRKWIDEQPLTEVDPPLSWGGYGAEAPAESAGGGRD